MRGDASSGLGAVWDEAKECYGLEGMEPQDVVDICKVGVCAVYSYHCLSWSEEGEIKSINRSQFSPKIHSNSSLERITKFSIYFNP